jgi:hypothetical protein
MTEDKKLKLLLSKYCNRHMSTIQRYFSGCQTPSKTVAMKMEKLTGLPYNEWKYPHSLGKRPWHYCIYNHEEIVKKLKESKL